MKNILQRLEDFMEHNTSHIVFAVLIAINAIILGLETIPCIYQKYGELLLDIDEIINYIFIVEVSLRMIGCGLKFFKNGWNVFDFIIVGGSLLASNSTFSVFRIFRILRLAEVISISKHMRVIVNALIAVLPGAMHMACVIGVVFYIFSLIGHDIFSQSNPDIFGTLPQSMMTLLLILLGDGIGDSIHATMSAHAYSYIFFIAYAAIMSFTLLNLLFGIVIDAVQSAAQNENNDDKPSDDVSNTLKQVLSKLDDLQLQVNRLNSKDK